MSTDSPTVLLMTGDDALHEELTVVLAAAGFEVCGRCRSTTAALDVARRVRPVIALLDIRTAGDVLAAISVLHRETTTESVVLLQHVDEHVLADAIIRDAAGAVAVAELRSLPASLRAVLAGEPALSRKLVARLLLEYRVRDAIGRGDGPSAVLSRREREVLELLRRGRTTQEVARELFLQPGHRPLARRLGRAAPRRGQPRSGAAAARPRRARAGMTR